MTNVVGMLGTAVTMRAARWLCVGIAAAWIGQRIAAWFARALRAAGRLSAGALPTMRQQLLDAAVPHVRICAGGGE